MSSRPGFTKGGTYFGPGVVAWSLPSGWSCPGARDCAAYRDRESGKVRRGKEATMRCYSVEVERFPATRGKVWANWDMLAACGWDAGRMAEAIEALLPGPGRAVGVRIHAGGDFVNQAYFDAWLTVAANRPDLHFWAFTKSVPFWAARLEQVGRLPNLALTASLGGHHDALAQGLGLRTARVVGSRAEAAALGLRVCTYDYLAMPKDGPSFALVENFGPERGGKVTP